MLSTRTFFCSLVVITLLMPILANDENDAMKIWSALGLPFEISASKIGGSSNFLGLKKKVFGF